jgi:hypothetical protein
MNAKVFNLALMILWLLICLGLLTRELWMPPDLLEKVNSPNTPLVISLAGILAAYNLMRLLIATRFTTAPARPSPATEEYRRRIRSITGEDPKVTDPQFKFDDDQPPNASH